MDTDESKPGIADRLRAWANASDSVGRHCANAADDEIGSTDEHLAALDGKRVRLVVEEE